MRVLMVCLGNICRSPLAEGILKKKIEEHDLNWSVDSAGTSGWHVGELPDPRSIETALNNGIDIRDQRSRKFIQEDFDRFDLILAMDSSNFNNMNSLARSDSDKGKLRLILNYSFKGMNRAVPDPYYEGGFQSVFDLINDALDCMIDEITSKDD